MRNEELLRYWCHKAGECLSCFMLSAAMSLECNIYPLFCGLPCSSVPSAGKFAYSVSDYVMLGN